MNLAEYELLAANEEGHWWFQSLHAFLLKSLPGRGDSAGRALDVGCGTGGWSAKLKSLGYETFGVDIEPLALGIAAGKSQGLNPVAASANELPFASNQFDLVTCIDVLECEQVDFSMAIDEALRVLKPGGHALFLVAAHQWLKSEHDDAVHSTKRLSLSQLRDLFSGKPCRTRFESYFFFLLFTPMAVWKLLRPAGRRDRKSARSDVHKPPALLNYLLGAVCGLESLLIPWIKLPMGTSACVLIEKTS